MVYKDPEKKKEYAKHYREIHKEEIKQRDKKYRENHKDKIKQYLGTHKEKIKKTKRNWYVRHKEEIREWGKKYREEHKDEIRQQRKKYYETHQEERRLYKRQYDREHRVEVNAKAKHYGEAHKGEINAKAKKYFYEHKVEVKEKRIIRAYNMNLKRLQNMLKDQSYKCAMCGKKINEHTACIDHSHITGTVRGLLCNTCNFNLGHYERLINYNEIIYGYLRNKKYNMKYTGVGRAKYRKQILEEQGYKCAICKCELTMENSVLDHDHKTKLIRGGLCRACNIGIEKYISMLKYKDKIDSYLEKGNPNID